jgi:hypothetical protein
MGRDENLWDEAVEIPRSNKSAPIMYYTTSPWISSWYNILY